jgi:hypothetical protein
VAAERHIHVMRLRYESPRRVSVYARVRSLSMALSVIWFARRANDDQAAYWIEHAEHSAQIPRARSSREVSPHKAGRVLTPQLIRRVQECAKAGVSRKDMAQRFGIHERRLGGIIHGKLA